MQNFSIQDCDWLRPVSASRERNLKQKASVQEMAKRTELLADFLYWFIDGFVISLVKVRGSRESANRVTADIGCPLDCFLHHRLGTASEPSSVLPAGRLASHHRTITEYSRPNNI